MRLLTRSADGRCRWIGWSVAFVAAFFVAVGAPSALAQSRADRPDLRVTKASFDGRNLHVEYVNATGVGYPKRRYEVGFQWYDAGGRPVGERHWLPVPEVERGGVAIFDTKYRMDLTYRRSGGNYNRRLLDFILQRPNTAEELRVTVDDGDRISETDETNNVAFLKIPLPDLQITGAKFLTPNQLELSYRNANPSPIPLPFRIGFTWAEEGGAYVNATRWINVLEPAAGATETVVLSRTDASYLTPQNRQAGDRLDWYFERRPGNATRLKITIDDAGTVREQNEQNNLVTARPFLPDLVVRDAKFEGGRLTFTYGNAGDGIVRDSASRVLFQWRDMVGQPVGTPRWYRFAQMDPKQLFPVKAERFEVEYAVTGMNRTATQRIDAYLREQPPDAVQLTITVDDEQRIFETDETNNVAEVAVPRLPQPDLAFARVTAKWDGRDPKIEYVGANRGTTDVERMTLGLQWLDANGNATGPAHPSYVVFGRLRAGGTSATWMLPFSDSGQPVSRALGRYLLLPPSDATHLRLMLDPENAVPESDEANNTALVERPASVPLSDLAITEARITADAFALTYKNIGPVHAGYFMTLSTWFEWVDASGARVGDLVWHNGESLDPKYATHLDNATVVSSSARAKFPLREFLGNPSDGATHLKVLLDGPNTLLESNEGNNIVLLVRSAVPLPDLAFTDLFLVPPKRERLIIGFQNAGKAVAPEFAWRMTWVDSGGKPLGEPYDGVVPTLKPNWRFGAGSDVNEYDPKGRPMTRGKWLRQLKPEGAVALEITIDPDNAIVEADEKNNRRTFDRWEPPEPVRPAKSDLTVGAVDVKDGALRITAKNVGGEASTPTDIWLMWFAGGRALSSSAAVDLPAIAVGKETTIAVPLDGKAEASQILSTPPKDGTRVRIFLDGSRKVAEQNEDNNDAFLERAALPAPTPVTVEPPKPDLVVEQVSVLPSKPTANAQTEFAAVIRNVGKAAAEESVAYVVLDLGGDGEPDSAPDPLDFPALKVGASFAKTWPDAETLPAGTHALEVCADVAEEVEESNEDNNCREIKFAVSAPARTSLLLLPLRLVLDVFSTPIRAGGR